MTGRSKGFHINPGVQGGSLTWPLDDDEPLDEPLDEMEDELDEELDDELDDELGDEEEEELRDEWEELGDDWLERELDDWLSLLRLELETLLELGLLELELETLLELGLLELELEMLLELELLELELDMLLELELLELELEMLLLLELLLLELLSLLLLSLLPLLEDEDIVCLSQLARMEARKRSARTGAAREPRFAVGWILGEGLRAGQATGGKTSSGFSWAVIAPPARRRGNTTLIAINFLNNRVDRLLPANS